MKVVLEFRHSHSVRIHICCFGEIIAVPEMLRFPNVVMTSILIEKVFQLEVALIVTVNWVCLGWIELFSQQLNS